LALFEERWVSVIREEEAHALEKAKEDPVFTEDVMKDWMAFNNHEVIPHFPPQIIIGK